MKATFIIRSDTIGLKWFIDNTWYGAWIDRTGDDLADMQYFMSKLGEWANGNLNLTLPFGVTNMNLRKMEKHLIQSKER